MKRMLEQLYAVRDRLDRDNRLRKNDVLVFDRNTQMHKIHSNYDHILADTVYEKERRIRSIVKYFAGRRNKLV